MFCFWPLSEFMYPAPIWRSNDLPDNTRTAGKSGTSPHEADAQTDPIVASAATYLAC